MKSPTRAGSWWGGALARAAAAALFAMLASCGGGVGLEGLAQALAEQEFYSETEVAVTPGVGEIAPGAETRTRVTVVFPAGDDFDFQQTSLAPSAEPGITVLLRNIDPPLFGPQTCRSEEIPSKIPSRLLLSKNFVCMHYEMVVVAAATASSGRTIVVSAQWRAARSLAVIERLGEFIVNLSPAAQRPPAPGFDLSVGIAPQRVYATGGPVPVSIARAGGFADPVALSLDGLGSGITGTFTPNPAPGGAATLQLDVPARYGEGGLVPLRVRGSAGGIDKTAEFNQRIEPLFSMALSPAGQTLASNSPLDVLVTISFDEFGPFAAAPPRMTLATSALPAGISAAFLPDTNPSSFSVGRTIRRTLRLSSDGAASGTGTLQVIATASELPPDRLNERPHTARSLALQATAGLLWEYLDNGASYDLTETDAVGIAMQSNNLPAIAWLEGRPGSRRVYVKRFDGSTFNASPAPGRANALVAPAGAIGEAGFALTASDAAKVAYTYDDATRLAVGSAGASWSSSSEAVALSGERLRTPRIAAGAGDTLALAYIAQTGDPATASSLFVKRSIGGSPTTLLAGPRGNGSLNRDADGRVVRGTTALAMRSDGSPVAAWIEQPADPNAPAAAWLRYHTGGAWSDGVAVPASKPLAGTPLQIAFDRLGTVVTWLQGNPAQLMVARYDAASMTWTPLTNTGNAEGSLNIATSQPARDTSLAIDAAGRIVVAWTEGAARPALWVKRQNADSTWGLLGTALSDEATTKSPRLASDANSQLYLGYTRYYSGGDLMTSVPTTDIFVTRWRFP